MSILLEHPSVKTRLSQIHAAIPNITVFSVLLHKSRWGLCHIGNLSALAQAMIGIAVIVLYIAVNTDHHVIKDFLTIYMLRPKTILIT